MGRLVCSARVLDAFVRSTTGAENAGALLRPCTSSARRQVRQISISHRNLFRHDQTSLLEARTTEHSISDVDAYIPLVSPSTIYGSHKHGPESPGWPPRRKLESSGEEERDVAGLVLDDAVLQIYLQKGLGRSQVMSQDKHDGLAEASGWNKDDDRATAVEAAFNAPDTRTGLLSDSRVANRKARKVRRAQERAEDRSQSDTTDGLDHTPVSENAARAADPSMILHLQPHDDEATVVDGILEEVARHEIEVEERESARAERSDAKAEVLDGGPKQPKYGKITEQTSVEPSKPTEPWRAYKQALKNKFGDQPWQPRKRISPDAISGVRALHAKDPETYSMKKLANYFQIPSEAVRRILKSKWSPDEKQAEDRRQRWERRGERKWTDMVEQGIRPPKKWREMGVGRVPKGELPTWRSSARKGGGERWIEQRSPQDLFARAAEHSARVQRQVQIPIGDRIL